MKFFIDKNRLEDPEKFIRRCSYGKLFNRRTNQVSYVRRLRGAMYPRLHLYIDDRGDKWQFNLHLDQRPTVYKGFATAHSGDYDGPVVEGEARRIQSFLAKQ